MSRGASTHRSVHSVRKACQSTATSGVTRATGCAGQGWDSSPIPEYVARHEIRRVDGSVSRIVNIFYSTYFMQRIFTPPPIGIGGRGIVFARFLSFFLSFFVSLSARLRENGWTDLHEIFREGVERPWDDLIQFWVNSDKRVAPKTPKTPQIAQNGDLDN